MKARKSWRPASCSWRTQEAVKNFSLSSALSPAALPVPMGSKLTSGGFTVMAAVI